MDGRTLAIGDIHGCSSSLRTLISRLDISPQDHLIFLGDYVDRGPDSRGVIDEIISLQSETQVTCLKGNHEVAMLAARNSQAAQFQWLAPVYGGAQTLASYSTTELSDIPEAHWDFLGHLQPFHETESHIFVHANLEADVPLQDQSDNVLYWTHLTSPRPHQSGKTMICGHTAQDSGDILNFGHAICIDTAVCSGGWLTALNVGAGTFVQASEGGSVREGRLK